MPAVELLEQWECWSSLHSNPRQRLEQRRSRAEIRKLPSRKKAARWALHTLRLLAELRGESVSWPSDSVGEERADDEERAAGSTGGRLRPELLATLLREVSNEPGLSGLLLGQCSGTPRVPLPEILHGAAPPPVLACFEQLVDRLPLVSAAAAGLEESDPSPAGLEEAVFTELVTGLAAFGLAREAATVAASADGVSAGHHLELAFTVLDIMQAR